MIHRPSWRMMLPSRASQILAVCLTSPLALRHGACFILCCTSCRLLIFCSVSCFAINLEIPGNTDRLILFTHLDQQPRNLSLWKRDLASVRGQLYLYLFIILELLLYGKSPFIYFPLPKIKVPKILSSHTFSVIWNNSVVQSYLHHLKAALL